MKVSSPCAFKYATILLVKMKTVKDSNPITNLNFSAEDQYNPETLEPRWQSQWDKDALYKTLEPKANKKGFYALSMFPYPSGTLHMGHVRNYVITDVIARYQRMKGKSVLHPMGWDAFGLPAENAAIERGIDPAEWTIKNIEQMKSQLKRLGLSVDWDREINTSDSSYYKWTQYLFLNLHKQGLAYQKKATVNWDPIDKTVLANEQVDAEGKSWRSGALVEKRELNQWFLGITQYSQDLLKDLDELSGWPERVKMMQSNWIGKSKGTEIKFYLSTKKSKCIEVFTTRPDTLFGVTYIVLSPNHTLINELTEDKKQQELKDFRKSYQRLRDIERCSDTRPKNGIFLGSYVINPINNRKIPVWTADYVLSEYGTGAVMGVPGHDQRDYEFASKYNLPIEYVIAPQNNDLDKSKAFLENGLLINSGQFNNVLSAKAKSLINKFGFEEKWAKVKVQYKLRDWLISRQRYWGCPIPIINCKKCGEVRVPEKDLPVELPASIKLSGKGSSPLSNTKEWISVACPNCGEPSQRETDTMDTFICSSWYFLRYADPINDSKPFDSNEVNKWLPVDQYVGGIEHAILHLLYSRFITKTIKSNNLIDINEPFKKLLTQGMVQAAAYKNPKTSKYIPANKILDKNNPVDPDTGELLDIIYEKMSKSKHNGIDPGLVIDRYGADTARMFILFKAPPEKDLEWEDTDVEGQYRFLQRLYKLTKEFSHYHKLDINKEITQKDRNKLSENEKDLRRSVHNAIMKVTEDLENNKLNTAISELMILTNSLQEKIDSINKNIALESISVLIRLLAPFSPHIAEELWTKLNGNDSIHKQNWPELDTSALSKDTFELVIQINGKVRQKINVPANLDKEELKNLALKDDISKKWLEGKSPKRVIVVKGKLVNIVI